MEATVKTGDKKQDSTKKSVVEKRTLMSQIIEYLLSPRDPSNLAVLRILFGILMLLDLSQERGLPQLYERWGDPDSCMFPLFNWLKPLPLDWMYILYLLMFVSEVGIVLGFCYKFCCFIFVICYWYIFFLDKGVWNNHSYLYGLTGVMLLLTDTNRYWSIDGLLNPKIKNAHVPMWNYFLFRFQIFLVYFYAGVKKLDLDWVFGYSMSGLAHAWVFDPFKTVLSNDAIDHYMVHICGLIFDLTEGFMLVWDKTRPFGIFLGSCFHLMNSQMFHIGMFPWTMLATMPLFCDFEWPKKVLGYFPKFFTYFTPTTDPAQSSLSCLYSETTSDDTVVKEKKSCNRPASVSKKHTIMLSLLAFYVSCQIFLPYSHFITKGYNAWTQGLYGYSWDMMVHSWQTQHIRIKVVDQITNEETFIKPGAFISGGSRRHSRWSSHPDMIIQYAHCLERQLKNYPSLNITKPAIYMDIWRSMNSRFQQRFVNPQVDFVTAQWSPVKFSTWLQPLLIELSPWRTKLKEIAEKTHEESNFTDIVFVADFPGLYLENFIQEDLDATISVLSGEISVEVHGKNTTLVVGEETTVPSNETHFVHTLSDKPSCYMYIYVNSTIAKNETLRTMLDQITENSTEYKMRKSRKEEWRKMSTVNKFGMFLQHKVLLFYLGFSDAYYAVKHLTMGSPYPWEEVESQENEQEEETDPGENNQALPTTCSDTDSKDCNVQRGHENGKNGHVERQHNTDQTKTEL